MSKLQNTIFQTKKEEEDLDPEDVELDEHYTIETRSKCKTILIELIANCVVFFSFFVYVCHLPIRFVCGCARVLF